MAEVARAEAEKIEDGTAIRLEGGPDGICVVRIGGSFYALSDRCSHANVPLSEGDVDADECTVECWKHGSTFSLLDGHPLCLPATQPVRVYEARVEGTDVVVYER
ncbi:MAG TPA: non-heme iron oxygenase ferredoxin subunit [Acidimicrobiales bacterium]|nr:non-heme iron oxygenase ferredoxin subunit [Acidimicrobiales bacterium]